MIRTITTFRGFLNRKADGEPNVQTLWIGLQRVKDFALAICQVPRKELDVI